MRLASRTKLFLISTALVLVSAIAADAVLTSLVSSHLSARVREGLLARAHLVARDASLSQAGPDDLAAWSRLARELARTAGAPVTFIRYDGALLGESEPGAAQDARSDIQPRGPDIDEALAHREGWWQGASPADSGARSLYVSVAYDRHGSIAGVARLSTATAGADRAVSDVRQLVWMGSAVVLVLSLALAGAVAGRWSARVDELTVAARRMSGGDLSVRTHLSGSDELAQLGRVLDQMAAGLRTTLGQLRVERDLQARILDAMQEGVVVVDRDGRIVLVNPALRSMLLVGADALGKLLIEAVRHAQIDELLAAARASAGVSQMEIDLPGLKPRRVLVHAAPLSGDDEGLLLVFVDMTDLRRLESLRRDFVANASHELRTPIAAVRSATETLRSGALDDPRVANRFVDIIERNAQRLQSLVEDMLELSKLESNEFKLKRERVEIGTVVSIVFGLFRERADKKGIQLAADFDGPQMPVEGDARALEHVLSNLIDNAIKYCPPGSRVLVAVGAHGDRVHLVVSDTGPGIPAEHLPRLFERFYRVDAGRSRELGGTGLGLSIVKHMVEAMRGKVSVESEVGRGSTFTVSLPRA